MATIHPTFCHDFIWKCVHKDSAKCDFILIHQTCRIAVAGHYLWWYCFLPKASFGLRVLSFPASVCLRMCLSVCVSVNPITRASYKHQIWPKWHREVFLLYAHPAVLAHTQLQSIKSHQKSDIPFDSQRSCLHPGCAHGWRMRDTLTQQTKQFGRRKFTLRVNHGIVTSGIRAHARCATFHLARDFKTPEFRRNCRVTYGIVSRGPIHSNWK